jgi:hypothetical protein
MGDAEDWQLILAINNLRNKVAHKFDGPERTAALRNLRNEFHRSWKANGAIINDAEWPDYNMVLVSSMNAIAFLVHLRTEVLK